MKDVGFHVFSVRGQTVRVKTGAASITFTIKTRDDGSVYAEKTGDVFVFPEYWETMIQAVVAAYRTSQNVRDE